MARHHLPHDGRGHRDGKALPGEGPAGRLIPVPRELTEDCGMSWRAEVQDRAALAALTEAERLEVDGFYELMI